MNETTIKNKEKLKLVSFKGKPYIKTETDTELILTSLNKEYGRNTILVFTKDKTIHNEATSTATNIIKNSIISNHFKKTS